MCNTHCINYLNVGPNILKYKLGYFMKLIFAYPVKALSSNHYI